MMDGNPKLGYMLPSPIPEELRLGNAFALGVQKTCPECTIVSALSTLGMIPSSNRKEQKSLFDAGAQVVMTCADTLPRHWQRLLANGVSRMITKATHAAHLSHLNVLELGRDLC
jgi:hypothetical protein